MHPDVRGKLGRFKNFLLALLHKNPLQRPSMDEFCRRCERALGAATDTVSEGMILQPLVRFLHVYFEIFPSKRSALSWHVHQPGFIHGYTVYRVRRLQRVRCWLQGGGFNRCFNRKLHVQLEHNMHLNHNTQVTQYKLKFNMHVHHIKQLKCNTQVTQLSALLLLRLIHSLRCLAKARSSTAVSDSFQPVLTQVLQSKGYVRSIRYDGLIQHEACML